jgi:hypothetical protein
MLKALITLILSIIFASVAFVVMLDWLGGCGETYTYADGSQHTGECLGRLTLKSLINKGITHG